MTDPKWMEEDKQYAGAHLGLLTGPGLAMLMRAHAHIAELREVVEHHLRYPCASVKDGRCVQPACPMRTFCRYNIAQELLDRDTPPEIK